MRRAALSSALRSTSSSSPPASISSRQTQPPTASPLPSRVTDRRPWEVTEHSLGYGGIPTSVAVKFDLYNNAGRGTGLHRPLPQRRNSTVPAINLSTTGINLHSGDIFNALITYNGSDLDGGDYRYGDKRLRRAKLYREYPCRLSAVRRPMSGLPAGTGGSSAVQNILNWSYSPVAVTGPLYAYWVFGGAV